MKEKLILEYIKIPNSKKTYRISFNGRNIIFNQGVELQNKKYGRGNLSIWVGVSLWTEFYRAVQRMDTKIRISRQDSDSTGDTYSFSAAIAKRNAVAKKKEKAKGQVGLDLDKIFGS